MTAWLVLLGCRPDDEHGAIEPPIPLYAGGDRLEAQVELFSAAQHLVAFHDRELDVDCTFEQLPGPDGRVRCVPEAPVVAVGFYADDACSEPVVPEAEPGQLVRRLPEDSCETEVGWYVATAPADGVYAREAKGDCQLIPDIAGVQLEPFDGDGFVAADLVVEPKGAIDAWVARADDGAWVVVSGWSAELQSPVARFGYGYGSNGEVWWPRLYVAFVYNVTFVDPDCTEPAAHKVPGDAACPVLFAVTFEASEPPLYHTGPQLDPADLWIRSETTGQCVDAALERSTDLYFPLGEAIFAADLEPIVEELSGSGRIQRRVLGSEGGEPVMLAEPQFWDEELGTPCGSSTALDPDQSYCVPPAVTSVAYADAQCDELLAELPEEAASWGAVSIAYDDGVRVQRLAAEVERVWTLDYTSGTAQCVRIESADREGRIYRRLGAEVPADGLVSGIPF